MEIKKFIQKWQHGKNKRWKWYKKIKKSPSEYRAEKITGFNRESVNEKIKSMEVQKFNTEMAK